MNVTSNALIDKLDERNYEFWKLHMRSVLVCNDLWGYVDGTNSKPNETDVDKLSTWKNKNSKALAMIFLGVKENQLGYIKKCTTANEAWTLLEKTHTSKGPARKVVLYRRLFQMKKKRDQTMTQHIRDFQNCCDALEEAGISIPKELLCIMLLNSLPEVFENFCIAIETRDELPDIATLKSKLLEEEDGGVILQ